jgi:hypothetical protein
MIRLRSILKHWLLLATLITLFAGMLYATTQAVVRQSANDPQIQIARDMAARLATGEAPASLAAPSGMDISQTLSPFVEVFDQTGKPIASTALLHGQLPLVPGGVFDFVRQNREERVTWQPAPDVRQAAVVVAYAGSQPGFVMAARSLQEVEIREDSNLKLIALGWALSLGVALVVVVFADLIA